MDALAEYLGLKERTARERIREFKNDYQYKNGRVKKVTDGGVE